MDKKGFLKRMLEINWLLVLFIFYVLIASGVMVIFDIIALFILPIFFALFLKFIGRKNRRKVFLTSIFGVFAKLIIADGKYTQSENKALEELARKELGITDDDEYNEVVNIFEAALKDRKKTVADYLRNFIAVFADDPASRTLFLRLLFVLSAADGTLHEREKFILKDIAVRLRIGVSEYNALLSKYFPSERKGNGWQQHWSDDNYHDNSKRRDDKNKFNNGSRAGYEYWYKNSDWAGSDWFKNDRQQQERSRWYNEQQDQYSTFSRQPTAKYYAVLGLSPSCTDAELKKAHRKLVMQNHPDKLMSKGLPHQAMKTANERFVQIQNAYEEICKIRKI